MIVRLDQVRIEPFRWQESLDLNVDSLDRQELVGLTPIDWRGSLTFNDPGFLLQGTVGYEQTLLCMRCLEPFAESVRSDLRLLVEEVGKPGARDAAGGADQRELAESELGVVQVVGDDLDMIPLLHEQVLLNLPMKPLCRPDCKGLCPRCGVNRNQGSCDCVPESDPRWSALSELKDRLKSEETRN